MGVTAITASVQLINAALIELGRNPITSPTEESDNNRIMQRLLPIARDMVLREHLWNCALTLVTLSPLADPPAFGFDRAFQLPADFIRLAAINNTLDYMVSNATVHASVESLELAYIARITDVNLMDAGLAECIAAKMAAMAAFKLSGLRTVKDDMEKLYRDRLFSARFADSHEGRGPTKIESTEWVDAHRGLYSDRGDGSKYLPPRFGF